MKSPVEIEDIEQLRRRAAIDDVELHEAIQGLRAGDYVKLTILAHAKAVTSETVLVRITRVKGSDFRGKLAVRPASPGFSELQIGAPLTFTADHIHSLPKGRLPDGP
jgi:hypothetical protein